MDEEKFGVEELKKFLHHTLKGFEKGYEIMKDGKIRGMEWAETPVVGFNIYKAVVLAGAAYEQWQDLDDDEFADVVSFLKEDFDLDNDILEEKIENILAVLMQLGEEVIDFFKKDEEPPIVGV
jgi:hypothetical protein